MVARTAGIRLPDYPKELAGYTGKACWCSSHSVNWKRSMDAVIADPCHQLSLRCSLRELGGRIAVLRQVAPTGRLV